MYQKGDVVIYSCEGPCVVDSIGPVTITASLAGKDYYTLHPYFAPAGTIYAPVDAGDRKMRPVITQEEVTRLIEQMPAIETVWTDDIQERKATFDTLLRNNNCTDLIKIIKTLFQQKKRRQAIGKALHVSDENYLREAQRLLYDEIAGVMGINPNEVNAYIMARVDLTA